MHLSQVCSWIWSTCCCWKWSSWDSWCFYFSSAELTCQHGAMASRGMRGEEDKLWLSKCNLEQRCWLLLLDTIWQLFSPLREVSCAGQMPAERLCSLQICRAGIDTSLLTKKTFVFSPPSCICYSCYFFCGWILGSTSFLAGFLCSLRLGCVETVPHCSCYAARSICLSTRTEFWQSVDFLLVLLELVKIKSEQCIEHCKCCLPESSLRFIWNSPVLTFKFVFQITKVWFEQLWHSCVWKSSNYAC